MFSFGILGPYDYIPTDQAEITSAFDSLDFELSGHGLVINAHTDLVIIQLKLFLVFPFQRGDFMSVFLLHYDFLWHVCMLVA